MKAHIRQDGKLELTPETELEYYALEKWHEGYKENGKEILYINLFNITTLLEDKDNA